MMPVRKLTLEVDGIEVGQASPAIFQRQITASGAERLVISVPPNQPDLFLHLASVLSPPYFVLYVLHTPRGEGEAGRYQSTELSSDELQGFLRHYQPYFANDARHDVWVYAPESRRTIIWDRHNKIFAEGQPLDDIVATLIGRGFKEGVIDPLRAHFHHYRTEFDGDASSLLLAFDWHRTPLRPEDEQLPSFNGDTRIDLKLMADQVRSAVEGYEAPKHSPDQLGTPLPPEWFERGLIEMRAALVEPYWVEMRDYDAVRQAVVRRSVVVVADDGDGSLVMFDPGADGDFALALREGDGIVSCGVRGDVVGCFLAR